MAIDYDALLSTTTRLIRENGRDIIVYRLNQTAADAAKPWRGAGEAPRNAPAELVTVKGVMMDTISSRYLGLTSQVMDNVNAERKYFVVSPGDTGLVAEDIENFDELCDPAVTPTEWIANGDFAASGDTTGWLSHFNSVLSVDGSDMVVTNVDPFGQARYTFDGGFLAGGVVKLEFDYTPGVGSPPAIVGLAPGDVSAIDTQYLINDAGHYEYISRVPPGVDDDLVVILGNYPGIAGDTSRFANVSVKTITGNTYKIEASNVLKPGDTKMLIALQCAQKELYT